MANFKEFFTDKLKVKIYNSRQDMGKAAANDVANQVTLFLKERDEINMVFAAAPSQNDFLEEFVSISGMDWNKINAFHMDEYIGIDPRASQSFGQFLRDRLFEKVPFKSVYYIYPESVSAKDECIRYSKLLRENPIDIVCLGIGENGHLAFNDPPVADFNDPELVKIVDLDMVCRQQQVNDGCFASIAEVPKKAITLSIPALLSGKYLSCVVPGSTKANAVKKTLEDKISTECPATILRQHKNTMLYLDQDSAQKIN